MLDVTDRAAPSLVQKTQLGAGLVSSRMVDGELRIVLSHSGASLPRYLPGIQGHLVRIADSGEATYRHETRSAYLERAVDDFINRMLPDYRALSVR